MSNLIRLFGLLRFNRDETSLIQIASGENQTL